MADIKIFIACHQEDVAIPSNPLIFPIQVGAALSNSRFGGMLHDDEGDNISEKNPRYCELTAQYWAWKNSEADYYGFFHYRRYLSFSSKRLADNHFADCYLPHNDEATLEAIRFNEKTMREAIEGYDLILPEKGCFVGGYTMREQYEREHYSEDIACAENIIAQKYPEMVKATNAYLDSKEGYFCNMFIMKRELFHAYCEWLFDILEEHEKQRDFAEYNTSEYRVSGYLAERLFGIYVTWLKERASLKYRELQRVFFEDTSCPRFLSPARHSADLKPMTLVLSANEFYVPYLGVLLESIKENSSAERFYDIIVLHSDITKNSQAVLARLLNEDNFSIRFFCTARLMREYVNKLYLRGHFRIETYFRLLMQDILPSHSKALYLDADMVVNRDIAELYDVDVTGYLLAAAQDPDTAGLYNGADPGKRNYMDNVLELKEPYGYFQAGTILFNLDEFRKTYTVTEMFEFASSYEWELLDQDVLNYFAQGRVKYVDMRWNVMMNWNDIRIKEIIGKAPRSIFNEYMNARQDPYIVHFAGPDKPWDNCTSDFADYFWGYAIKTPFVPEIIERSFAKRIPAEKPGIRHVIKETVRPLYDKLFPKNTRKRETAARTIQTLLRRG